MKDPRVVAWVGRFSKNADTGVDVLPGSTEVREVKGDGRLSIYQISGRSGLCFMLMVKPDLQHAGGWCTSFAGVSDMHSPQLFLDRTWNDDLVMTGLVPDEVGQVTVLTRDGKATDLTISGNVASGYIPDRPISIHSTLANGSTVDYSYDDESMSDAAVMPVKGDELQTALRPAPVPQ